ncbi:MAG: hypothetical protein HEQ19_30740 [Gloeotrichia echinulata CP02]
MTQLLNLPEVLVESSLQEGQVLILSVGKKRKVHRAHTVVKTQDIYIKIKNV